MGIEGFMSEIKTIEQLFVAELLELREENARLVAENRSYAELLEYERRKGKRETLKRMTEEDWKDRRFQDADWE